MKKFYNNLLNKYQVTSKDILVTYFIFFLYYTSFLPIRKFLFITIFIVSAFWFFKKRNFLSKSILRYLSLVIFLWVFQSLFFGSWVVINFARGLIGILIPYFGVKLLGKKFIRAFIVVMFLITIVSFFFYLPSYISNSFHKSIGKIAPTLHTDIHLAKSRGGQNFLLFTWEPKGDNGLIRNSGNFTEPGYFACYLSLALVLNIMYLRKIKSITNLLFILGLISTFSTAAYITLFFILIFFLTQQKNKLIPILLLPILLGVGFYSFTKLEFLEKKLTIQIESQARMSKTVGRFGATLRNLEEIKENPLFGKGIVKQSRFDTTINYVDGYQRWQNLNSHSNLLVLYGIPGFLFFTFWLFQGFANFIYINELEKKYWLLLVGVFYLVLAAQPIISTPVFISFLFWEKKHENINYHTKL